MTCPLFCSRYVASTITRCWTFAACGDMVALFIQSLETGMPRPRKLDDLAAIEARREALWTELAQLDEQAKTAALAARDAGRPVLLAALEQVKIAELSKHEAKAIANAISRHGGRAVADHLSSLASA